MPRNGLVSIECYNEINTTKRAGDECSLDGVRASQSRPCVNVHTTADGFWEKYVLVMILGCSEIE